jgi:hypothetical protein
MALFGGMDFQSAGAVNVSSPVAIGGDCPDGSWACGEPDGPASACGVPRASDGLPEAARLVRSDSRSLSVTVPDAADGDADLPGGGFFSQPNPKVAAIPRATTFEMRIVQVIPELAVFWDTIRVSATSAAGRL